MNAQAAEALYAAEAAGVKQIKNVLSDPAGGRCALGVIRDALSGKDYYRLANGLADGCPLCGVKRVKLSGLVESLDSQWHVIAHLNDHHDLTFSEIARKLGPDHA